MTVSLIIYFKLFYYLIQNCDLRLIIITDNESLIGLRRLYSPARGHFPTGGSIQLISKPCTCDFFMYNLVVGRMSGCQIPDEHLDSVFSFHLCPEINDNRKIFYTRGLR